MHEPLWSAEQRGVGSGASANRFAWLWISLAVLSALLLTGWPLPEGVSSSSTATPRAFQLFPGAFDTEGVAADHAVSTAETPREPETPRLVASSAGATVSIDPLTELQMLAGRAAASGLADWTPVAGETPAPASVLPSVAHDTVARPVPPPTVANSSAVSAPAATPTVAPAGPLAGAVPQPATPAVAPSGGTATYSARELGLFNAMNEQRVANGLAPLVAKDVLTTVARLRSEEMVRLDYFAHFYPGGTSAYTLLQQQGATFNKAGENLAKVAGDETESVAVAIDALMASPTHRANILEPDFTRVGVGAVTDENGVTVFTTIFADR